MHLKIILNPSEAGCSRCTAQRLGDIALAVV